MTRRISNFKPTSSASARWTGPHSQARRNDAHPWPGATPPEPTQGVWVRLDALYAHPSDAPETSVADGWDLAGVRYQLGPRFQRIAVIRARTDGSEIGELEQSGK